MAQAPTSTSSTATRYHALLLCYVRYAQLCLRPQPFGHCFHGRVPIPHLHKPKATMLYRSCPILKILLATSGLWTTLCLSSHSVPTNLTATSTNSFGHTYYLSGGVQNAGDIVTAANSTSYPTASSSRPSSSQHGCSYVLGYATFWPGPSVITRTDSTICPSLASMAATHTCHSHPRTNIDSVSAMPTRIDATSTLPHGFGVYENTTFTTSCAHNDPSCYAKCTAMATACGSKWFQWTSRNSYLAFTQSPTSFSTTTITSQNYSYSTSIVHEGEARITFEYASPIGKPILTTTSVQTLYSMDRVVTRWTEPPPTCTPSAWLKCTKGPDCRACTVQGGTVEVLFWPSASEATSNETSTITSQGISGSSGGPNGNISQPLVTAMFGTHTLTSPSVYISFQTAYALDDCGQTVGKAMPGALLPMDPHSLFTMRAGLDYFEVTSGSARTTFYESASFDYNDFNGPVPPSAYTNQPSCLASGCYTIYPDYHPQLALPPQVRSMDPAWASCALDWHGAWDPPVALSKAKAIATPTVPGEVALTEPASPKSTIGNPATMTYAPVGLSSIPQVLSDPSFTSPGSPIPMFTYSPKLPSGVTQSGSTLVSSQHSNAETTASSVIQITTILQIDPQPTSSGTAISDTTTTLDSDYQPSVEGSASDEYTSPTSTSKDPPPHTSEVSHAVTSTADQIVSKAPSGGLAISDKTITVGGDAITAGGVIYSAISGDALLVVSNAPVPSVAHSPTDAYEVLSEALGTATGHVTYSLNTGWSETAGSTTDSLVSQDNSAESSSSAQSIDPEVVIDLDSTTVTATQRASSTLQVGSQLLGGEHSMIVIDGHTLSTAPNAIVFDGTTESCTTKHAQHPTVLTLSSTLLTVQEAGPSGAIEIDSHTLMPGSSALITEGHTLSAASSGLMQDGSLVATQNDTSFATSVQSLTSVQAGQGSELPSVVSGPAIEGGEGQAASSSEASSDVSSGTGQSRQMGYLSWAGAAVFLLACIW
jgi:hypothetical protein